MHGFTGTLEEYRLMTITTTILTTPAIIAILSLDAFTWLLAARLVLGHLAGTRDTAAVRAIMELVDPVHHAVGRKLASWRQEPVPGWMVWLVLVVLLIGSRHVLVFFVNNVF